jgi:hypothetical protein
MLNDAYLNNQTMFVGDELEGQWKHPVVAHF